MFVGTVLLFSMLALNMKMAAPNLQHWSTLRAWIEHGTCCSRFLGLVTGALLPIAECVFVNLLTAATTGKAVFAVALITLASVHLALLAMQTLPRSNYPFQCVADAVELGEKVRSLEGEILRKATAHNALRCSIDALNLQTCQINPLDAHAFAHGMHPVICGIVSDAQAVLGVKGNAFTIELYCEPSAVAGHSPCAMVGGIRQYYFYSPVSADPCSPIRLGARSPCAWGWQRRAPGTCRIAEDPNFFYNNGQRPADSYYRTICTVPVYPTCSKEIIGVFVLTSMQDEPLAPDVIETMQFVSSLISQYIAAHNRCVYERGQAHSAIRGSTVIPTS